MIQQGIEIDLTSVARGALTAQGALDMFVEHLRYAGLATVDGTKATFWLRPGVAAGPPTQRIGSFLHVASVVERPAPAPEVSPQALRAARAYAQWHLGDPSWAGRFVSIIEEADPVAYVNRLLESDEETVASVLEDE